MINIEELKKMRFEFLKKLYEESDGNTFKACYVEDIGVAVGFCSEEVMKIRQYLKGEGLLKSLGGRTVAITHEGIKEIEEALSNPNKPTEHFPAVINNFNTNINHAENLQIQQGTVASQQSAVFNSSSKNEIQALLSQLKSQLSELKLTLDAEADLETDVATIEIQLNSPRPKTGIINESLGSIRNILEGAAGGVAAQQLMVLLASLSF